MSQRKVEEGQGKGLQGVCRKEKQEEEEEGPQGGVEMGGQMKAQGQLKVKA